MSDSIYDNAKYHLFDHFKKDGTLDNLKAKLKTDLITKLRNAKPKNEN